ncbi:MAG: type II toxin-antitoxin system VapC family toxin [Bacteroidetes bacterium]|nr:type II toxin-antitoxin system VapC family toxin [Bacteroidota bacterium]
MIPALPDLNVWLALSIPQHAHHQAAMSWFQMGGTGTIMFCRSTQQGFLRLLTTGAVTAPYGLAPYSNRKAITMINGIMEDPRIDFAEEPKQLWPQWMRSADTKHAAPKLWMDAYLAAFALAGGYQLVSLDKAFKQFKGVNLKLLG